MGEDAIPKQIGRYELGRELGRGGSGMVYLAQDRFEEREVAVKIYFTDAEVGERQAAMQRQAFFNEAHLAGLIRHPNILTIYDAGEEGDRRYIVMEFFPDAHPLAVYTKPDNLLPLKKTVEIIFACAKALDTAHRHGVVHRDIKPANLMMNADGQVKIVDFGTALSAKIESNTATNVVGVVGTPRYMSPEHIRDKDIGPHSDQFSLGIMAYELLTGMPCFGASNLQALMNQVLSEPPPPMDTLRPDLPQGLVDVVMKAISKKRQDRYPTCMDLGADLAKVYSDLAMQEEEIAEKEKYQMVRKLAFFTAFDQLQIWEIIRACQWRNFGDGDEIITEGDIDDCFYVIVFGEVTVIKGETELGTLKTGNCFGEMGYISHIRRTATIRAKGMVSLMRVNATFLEQVSKECQLSFYKTFSMTLIKRLAETNERLLSANL
jgi:eukaryotic-like serine/threonine-protein kinase